MGTTHLTAEQFHDVQRLRDSGAPVKQVWERLVRYGDSYDVWHQLGQMGDTYVEGVSDV